MKFIMALTLLMFFTLPVGARSEVKLIYLNTAESQVMFDHATDRDDFFDLLRYYETQQSQAYCGVASAVMVLNAMNITAPANPVYYPNSQFNQTSVLNKKVLALGLTAPFINKQGLTLDQEASLLKTYPAVSVGVHHMSDHSKDNKTMILSALSTHNQYVIVNFLRKGLGQEGAFGHFSVLAAYNHASDSVLVLDVARYKYPPFWVKMADLLNAMNTADSRSKQTRGYLIVGRKT